jgi:AraC-like DNA-binding protein
MTVEQRFSLPSGSRVAGVRFRPGMAGQILGVAPAELTDSSVALDALWGASAREIEERIATTNSVDDALNLLLACLAPGPPPNPVQRAIEFISAADGCADLDFIARQANLSPRQFRRRCLEESGLTPKQLCRVLRFRHATRLAQNATQPNWSGIANDAGYFDQSHLIRDFREFTGRPPVSVFSNTVAIK